MDPWSWTVDEVVHNLCNSRDLWKDRPNSSLPDPRFLEDLLRDNEVNGATLLQDVTKQTLKDDFGIKKLGERSALVHAVAILQARSPSYISHKANLDARERSVHDVATIHSPATTPLLQTPTYIPQFAPAEASPLKLVNEPHVRQGEIIVTDKKGGRKRRKIQPVVVEPPKKLSTTTIEHSGYLMTTKVPLDQIFYGDVENDENLPTDDEDDFQFVNSPASLLGHSQFIKKRLHHYLQTTPSALRDGRYALYPYPQKLVPEGKGQSVTLYKPGTDGGVSATRRDALLLDNNTSEDEDVKNNHDWDFLGKWIRRDRDEDILPAYGDSGSENDFSLDLMNEIEGEQQEKSKDSTSFMNREAVEEAITNAIETMEGKWHLDKEPKREQSAYRTWCKGQGRKGISSRAIAKQDLEHVVTVILNLRKAICDEVWKKPEQIAKQCASLELSVFNRLDLEWKLNLWQRRHAPSRPPRVARPVTKTSRVDTEEDAESLESEFDPLDDFVEDEQDSRMIDVSDSPYMSAHEDLLAHDLTPLPSPTLPAQKFYDSSPLSHGSDNDLPTSSPLPELSEVISSKAGFDGPDTHHSEPLHDTARVDRNSSYAGTPDRQFDQRPSIIDLTGSSPPPTSPILRPMQNSSYGEQPETSNNEQVAGWSWDRLELLPDRKRLIMKIYLEMDTTQRSGLLKLIDPMPIIGLRFEIETGLKALNLDLKHIPGRAKEDFPVVVNLARLFACWYVGKRFYWTRAFTRYELNDLLNDEDAKEDMDQFLQFSKDLIVTSDLFEAELLTDVTSTRKKRKKLLPKSQKAQDLQETAHLRQLEESNRAAQNIARLKSSFLTEEDQDIPVNIGKRPEDEFIFINRHIAPKLKPHQIDGVRFMWRELLNADKGRQGCLLAHTMGLGKTLQTIALLATIADAANSDNPNIVDLIPECLRFSRTLILCPVALIDNWSKEFELWMPQDNHIGNVVTLFNDESVGLSRSVRKTRRTETIRSWWNYGGVLIMGFELFRGLITNAPSGKDKTPLFDAKEFARMKKYLLKAPTMVIADEAHKLKNRKSAIGVLVRQFRTQSRLALTGSPLANNLEDYYNMIDWVAHDYLGPFAEFKSYYQDPIEAGFYADSTRADQRRSLKKLQALMADIDPKVQRADISVMKGTLKNKIEFVITVPLTDVQRRLYVSYVQALKAEELTDVANTRILDWISFLHLLCCHPSLFIQKLTERGLERNGKAKAVVNRIVDIDEEDDTSIAVESGELPTTTENISKSAIDRLLEIFSKATVDGLDKEAFALSHKAAIIAQIVVRSKEVGDKVLLFSHNIPVLNYFESTLERYYPGIKSQRLDGKTKSAERVSRLKAFQNNEYDLFIISTRAGGLGLNLPAANRVILVDFGFNPTWEEQAIGRAYRMGQQKPVYVYHLITGGTFETTMMQRTNFKTQLAIRTIDKKNVVSAAEKSAMYLFEPQDIERNDVNEYIGKDPDVLDLILETDVGKEIYTLSTTEVLHIESKDILTDEELKEVEQMKADDKLRRTNPQAWKTKKDEEQSKLMASRVDEQARLFQQHRVAAQGVQFNGFASQAPLSTPVPNRMTSLAHTVHNGAMYLNRGTMGATQSITEKNPNNTPTRGTWANVGFGAAVPVLPETSNEASDDQASGSQHNVRPGGSTPGGTSNAASNRDEMAEMMSFWKKS